MDERNCIICNKPGTLIEIKLAALRTLIASSKKRSDRKYLTMQKMTSAFIHTACQAMYNRQSSIDQTQAAKRMRLSHGKETIKEAKNFDFNALCFFCGKTCNKYKHDMHFVTNQCTKQNIIEIAEERKSTDAQCTEILARLNSVNDLLAVNARYHSVCMANFQRDSSSFGSIGRPPSESTVNFIEYVIHYIENNKDECQFSLNEIKSNYTNDDTYKFPDVTTIKKKLATIFLIK